MISQDMISDEHFNQLSLEAQNIFVRMLSVSDDCGVVPANEYRLNVLINTPQRLRNKMPLILKELWEKGMGYVFDYKDDTYFAFKPSSFEDYQSYILKKATKSEYLRIPKDEFEKLSKNFQELPRISSRVDESAVSTVTSKKQKVESKEHKVESKEMPTQYGRFNNVLLTPTQYAELVFRLGSNTRANNAIEMLSAYKESSGKKYKSDYATFSTWVIEKLQKVENNGNNRGGYGESHTKKSGAGGASTNDDIIRTIELAKKYSGTS